MRTSSFAQLIAASVVLGIASGVEAQGSWLPYGTSGASDVAVSPAGVVWLIGREPRSIRPSLILGETRFVTPRGLPARVAVDLNGFPWLLNSDGSVWHWVRGNSEKEDWVKSPLQAIDIAVGANGAVWAIDTEKRVVQLRNSLWEPIGGEGVRISVDPSGNPWIVNAAGQVSHWTGNSWAQIPASATDISVAPDGTVFILGTTPVRGGLQVLRLNGSTWEPIVGGGGVAISAGSQNVFVAQDTTTNLVLASANVRLRVMSNAASTDTTRAAMPSTVPGGNGTIAGPSSTNPVVSQTASANAQETARTAKVAATPESAGENGASIPLPSAGSVVGALGALGGLLSRGATTVAAVAPVAIPSPGAIGQAAAGAAAGAVAGAAVNAAGGAVRNAVGNVLSNGAPGSPASTATPTSPHKVSLPESPSVPGSRPSLRLPMSGSLRCPIIGSGATMERGCELLGRAAMKLREAPSADCAAPAFADSRNGGECWTCPASFTRSSTPVDADDACAGPASQRSVATLVKGCATSKAPPGYGTPFRDSPSGSECWVCPFPLQRSWSAVTSLTKGNLSACFGKAKELLVWQLGQYPETGSYRFMPGLLSIALTDPKAVDAFLDKRANGDTARKREIWAEMIADPSGSAELKALLFASLLSVAKQDSVNPVSKVALHEFESYVQARRVYVAGEALRMYKKAREVDTYYVQAKDSGGIDRIRADAVETAATDFKTYAWSSVMPDSAGTAFILASSALSKFGATDGAQGVVDAAISSLNVRYLEPVTKALDDQLDMLQDIGTNMIAKAGTISTIANSARALKGADPAMIGTTLLSGAMKVSKGVMGLFNKDKVAAEYEKYVEEMNAPVRVKEMMESTKPDERQTLLLYWALATSAHKASDKIGSGAMTGVELCNADSWTAAECSSAKAMIQAAAKAAGY